MEQQRSLVQAPVLPLRPRPRLRAKTGCLTCRSRRKKCTERKPQCHGCERLSIQCVWPEAAAEKRAVAKTSSRHSLEKEPAQSSEYSSPLKPLLPGNCLRYKPSLSEDEVLLFRYFNEKYTLLVFEPKVHPGFMNAPLNLLAELKRVRCITDLVLAISAMHLSNKLGRYTRIATEYYVSALGSLRSMVDGGEIEGSEDWLMLMVTLLCLYERWRPDPVSNMLIHLRGAMQVYQLRMKRVGKAPGHVITPFECLVTECTVYNITTLSLFTDLDTDMVSAIFETADYIHRSKPDIGVPALLNSPILRVGPRLHHVICKISQLCRRSPLQHEDQGSLDALADELRIACVAVDEAIGLRPSDNTKRALYPAKLFAIAANIMFYKLQHPEIQASCFWIQSKVQEALHTIQSIPGPYLPWQSICWQMYIVGCAVVRYSDMVFLRGRLQTFWDGSSCGDIARVAKALEANWAARGTEGAGLDILLQKRSALYQ